MSDTVTFHNPTNTQVNCGPLGLGTVEPGEDIEVPLALCAAKRMDNGSRGRSSIEKNCPQLQPKDPVFAKEWSKAPLPSPAVSRIVMTTGRAPSIPAGVLAAREAKAIAEAAKPAAEAAKPAQAKPVATTSKPAPVTAKPAQAKPSTPAKPAEEPAPPAAEPEAKA